MNVQTTVDTPLRAEVETEKKSNTLLLGAVMSIAKIVAGLGLIAFGGATINPAAIAIGSVLLFMGVSALSAIAIKILLDKRSEDKQ